MQLIIVEKMKWVGRSYDPPILINFLNYDFKKNREGILGLVIAEEANTGRGENWRWWLPVSEEEEHGCPSGYAYICDNS